MARKTDRDERMVSRLVATAIDQIELLIQEGREVTALAAARDLKKIIPWIPYPYLIIADIHRAMGHNAKAIREVGRLITMFPDDYEVLQAAAGSYRDLGKGDEAMRTYENALTKIPPRAKRKRADLLNEMGTLAWDMGRSPEAVDFYRRALELVPAHKHASRNLDESLNAYGEPRRGSPLQDDLHHFINIQIEAWITAQGKQDLGSLTEAQKVIEQVMNEWNNRIAPLREKLDGMTAAEKSELFHSVGFAARR